MTNEREELFQPLTFIDYDIAGNSFRAYYDADNKLVFVLDFVVTDVKPNVLLIINPVGDRKWDDILENDYGVDLETVRPKKDNKYQKLDIEYAGLAQYDELFHAYENGDDLDEALHELMLFRNAAAKRAAQERLGAAELTASRSRETIEKTNEKIAELQGRIKTLRQKLADAKQQIGKEPTKQSASKILRIESQIDSVNEKLKRAKKRLANAQHRLVVADDEIDVAQGILNKLNVNLPASPAPVDVMITTPAPVPAEIKDNVISEPKAENMADDEVKPLFDTDPNIIDEEIAFKPIEFDAVPVVPAAPVVPVVDIEQDEQDEVAPIMPVMPVEPIAVPSTDVAEEDEEELLIQPLSFTPPTNLQAEEPTVDTEQIAPNPIFDGFTPFPSDEQADNMYTSTDNDKPVQDVLAPVVGPEYKPDDAEVAPVESEYRPVSPITNEPAAAVTPVDGGTQSGAKPTMLYYILLGVLIVLSVFTLWFYQKSANDTLPELGAKTEPAVVTEEVVAVVAEPEPVVVEPTVDVEPVSVEPVINTELEAEVVEVTEPVVESEVAAEIVPVTEPVTEEPVKSDDEQKEDASPFIELETLGPVIGPMVETPEPAVAVVPTEEEILAKKPAYGAAARSDEMFVAAPEYETETTVATEEVVVTPVATQPEPIVVDIPEPVVTMSEPEIVTEYTEEFVSEEEMCSDGNPPDMYGCCTGEEFVLLPDGERACCAESTGECFPPM